MIRKTREGLPCFDEFSKLAREQEMSNNWADIVALHSMVCGVVENKTT